MTCPTQFRSFNIVAGIVVAVSCICLSESAYSQYWNPTAPRGETHEMALESGPRANRTESDQVVYANIVRHEGAAWIRLHMSDLTLEGTSRIRYTSLLDGDVQEMDAVEAAMWNNTSAYFNGDSILIELIAAPGTNRNKFSMKEVEIELLDENMQMSMCGICFGEDTRVPSDEDFAGRVMNVGCSAAVYNPSSCIVSAGHCVPGGFSVIQFRVPNSTPGCNIQHPSSIHQYPITSVEWVNGGVGNDWAVATTGLSQGMTIYQRYGEYRPLASTVPSSGTLQVWGFGVSKTCILSQTQQRSDGPITSLSGSAIFHRADTTGGNSGSGMFFNDQIIGVVTHCSSPCPGGSNVGIRIDQTTFRNTIESFCPSIPPEPPSNNTCPNRIVVGEGSTAYTNEHATTDGPSESDKCTFFGDPQIQHDVWFQHTASCTGELTVAACDGTFNTKVGLYLGSSCPTQSNTVDECDTTSCPNNRAMATIAVEEGDTVIIRVGSRSGGAAGDGTINVTCEEVAPPACPADLNDDGVVDGADLLILLGQWGNCPGCDADLNGDDVVDGADLLILLGAWGGCP